MNGKYIGKVNYYNAPSNEVAVEHENCSENDLSMMSDIHNKYKVIVLDVR